VTAGSPPDPAPAERIRLPDGRSLGYAEYGDPQGLPLFYFHGWPGSRVEARFLDPAARERGLRVIAMDRPGMGLSDFQADRAIAGWPGDVEALADSLGLDRFAVLGVSGGGPYAAACAGKIGRRVTTAGIVSSLSPVDEPGLTDGMLWMNRMGMAAARWAPWLTRPVLGLIARRLRRPRRRALSHMISALPEVDREALDRPEFLGLVVATFREAFRNGTRGVALDGILYTRPWGFRPEAISVPVHLWHGELDRNVPVAMGRRLAAAIPGCRAAFLPGEGHFSLIGSRPEVVLEAMLSGDGPPPGGRLV
jgi:pimeloyl-ACP methyl ester carboxylesterase